MNKLGSWTGYPRVTNHMYSERKRAVIRLKLRERHHVNGVPRAAFEERAVGAFAGAEFAADAEKGIDDDAPERRMVLVRRPIHAISDWAVFDASRRPRASRAGLVDDGKDVRLALALVGLSRGDRRILDDSSFLIFLNAGSGIRQFNPPRMNSIFRYSC